MNKFALETIDAIKGKQRFEKLLVDGVCLFDEFEKNLEKKYKRNLQKIYYYMESVANNMSLPCTKFKDVTPDKETVKEYEFKDGDLRVYAISTYGGKIVVLGGYKNAQKADFRHFRSIKKEYLKEVKKR